MPVSRSTQNKQSQSHTIKLPQQLILRENVQIHNGTMVHSTGNDDKTIIITIIGMYNYNLTVYLEHYSFKKLKTKSIIEKLLLPIFSSRMLLNTYYTVYFHNRLIF